MAKKKAVPEDDGDLEKRTMSALKKGPKTSTELKTPLERKDYPALSRTLQRLRRQGKIVIVKGRWAVESVSVCPKCEGKGWVDT